MENNYTCGICGEVLTGLDAYTEHIMKCATDYKKKKESKEEQKKLKEINELITTIKNAQDIINQNKDVFKNKYPEEYEFNFGKDKCSCKHESDKSTYDSKSLFKDKLYTDSGYKPSKRYNQGNQGNQCNQENDSYQDDFDVKTIKLNSIDDIAKILCELLN